MKKLLQIGLLLWLAANATAQESPAQNQPKVLRTYDWKDLNVQSSNTNCQIQIISMDGVSVLKIEKTNDVSLEISLLTITNPSLIQKANAIEWEMKYEHVPFDPIRSRFPAFESGIVGSDYFTNYPNVCLFETFPPRAAGGDNFNNYHGDYFNGTKNWDKYEHQIFPARYDNETRPNELKLKLFLPCSGTIYLRPIKLLGTASSFNWWSEKRAGLVGGIGGSIIGCFGALVGVLASRGKARKFVLALTKIFIVLGFFLLLAGAIAAAMKQPYVVYYPLLLTGFILTIVFSVNLPSIQRRYDELEIRRITSIDTMGS
jgi:hypothetical protein